MSAFYGFLSRKEFSFHEVASKLSAIWEVYVGLGWEWKLRNPENQRTEFGIAYKSDTGDWQVIKDCFKSGQSIYDLFDRYSLENIVTRSCICEITQSAYDGYSAPIHITRFGAGGVIGEVTRYMEEVVGVEKDASASIGGGIGFLQWLSNENNVDKVKSCNTHAIFIAVCNLTGTSVHLVRSQGAEMNRLFYTKSKDQKTIRFSSVQEPLIKYGSVTTVQKGSYITISLQ